MAERVALTYLRVGYEEVRELVHDPSRCDTDESNRTIWTWTSSVGKSYTLISPGSKRCLEGTYSWARLRPHLMMNRLKRLRIYLGCRRIVTSDLFRCVSMTVRVSLVFLYIGHGIYNCALLRPTASGSGSCRTH